uniref:Uncharacterized protein n=1 Tax=Rhizophora mucronata TaxID=61149 RepID=A0A2P2N0G8_RHIMU
MKNVAQRETITLLLDVHSFKLFNANFVDFIKVPTYQNTTPRVISTVKLLTTEL